MLKDLIIAFQAYGLAHAFIKKHKLWKWIIIPGIIYAILFFTGMYFFAATANDFFVWLKTLLEGTLNKINSGIISFIITFGSFILWVMIMLLYFSLFKYLFLIVGSPIFAYLSEKTESIIEGRNFPFSIAQLIKDIIRGCRLALRNGLWQTVYWLSILFIGLIPVIGWFTPFLLLLIECYFYGFSMLDYSMERHKKSVGESIFFINNHKGLALGNGIVFYLLHIIPIVGWILAPAYAVIAATLTMQNFKQEKA